MEPPDVAETLVFGRWQFDRPARRLYHEAPTGSRIQISVGSRALDILALLLERPGTLVSKEAIMDAVWPNAAVEANNLTVQVSALRHVLDHGRTEGSCIQTVPGRGYRFVVPVVPRGEAPAPIRVRVADRRDDDAADTGPGGEPVVAVPGAPAIAASRPRFWRDAPRRPIRLAAVMTGACLALGAVLLGVGHLVWPAGATAPPRLSVVVLPFKNLGGDAKDDYLAEGVTDDLTSDLSHISGAFVIAHESAVSYKNTPKDVRTIGKELGVRYVVEGSVRRIDPIVRINVRLTSAETGENLWSDRFDEPTSNLSAGQEQIVARMRAELGINMVDIESARSLRERPTHPDAFDLILQARALQHGAPSLQQYQAAQALYQRALALDPSSAPAIFGVGFNLLLTAQYEKDFGAADNIRRIKTLLAQARRIAPGSDSLYNFTIQWLQLHGRFREGVPIARAFIQQYPNDNAGYFDLAQNLIILGHADEAIPLEEDAIRLNPMSPWLFARYRDIGYALLLLGKDTEAISVLERSLALNPDNIRFRAMTYRRLAAAYARTDRMDEARQSLADADRLWPYDTARAHWPYELVGFVSPDPVDPVTAAEIRRYQDGLRLAGERDHADQDADFGVRSDAVLHDTYAGLTPTSAPGATTLDTRNFVELLQHATPLIIDTESYSWGRSIPGAVGLRNAGMGGSFTDTAESHLGQKMQALTRGNRAMPIVAVGWNSERFDGRNLALRLVALGYTRVYWYRGGREAWEVANLPETDLMAQEW